jgi:hypothetical protein
MIPKKVVLSPILFRNKTRGEIFHFFNGNTKTYGERYTDNAVIMSNFNETRKMKNGEIKVFPPKFIIFSDIELKAEYLADLKNIRF